MPNRVLSRSRRNVCLALCAAVLVCSSVAGVADDDHDRARRALEAGEVLPLRAILDRVEREHPEQVVDVELDEEDEDGHPRWVYEVKVLRSGGSLVKLKVDARDGTIIGRKTRGSRDAEGEWRGNGRGGEGR